MSFKKKSWGVVAALFLAGGLASPPARALAPEAGWLGLGAVWSWLSAVLPYQALPASPAADKCSSIDPDGRCVAFGSANSDKGSSIDPNGANSDKGASIDPNGGGVAFGSANSDKGFSIDPNGGR